MRRGSLNKYSVVVIFIAALFTVFAYFFDQLVIRSEDKIRNLKINLQNVKNNKNNYEFIASTLTNIVENAQMNFAPLILRRNLTIKSLILSTTKDKKIFKNVDDIEWELIRNFNTTLVSSMNLKNEYINFYIDNKKNLIKLNDGKIKDLDNLFSSYSNIIVNKNNYFFHDNTEKYLKLTGLLKYWKNKEEELSEYRNKALKDFTIYNWFDVYRYKMLILSNIEKDLYKLSQFTNIADKKVDGFFEAEAKLLEEIKSSGLKKNYYILLSITSQIMSLLFLLILFRGFIKR
tara:strand:+ start:103 stop:969 length:867 start_codon:yes stop_codon:yes gene_type:complete